MSESFEDLKSLQHHSNAFIFWLCLFSQRPFVKNFCGQAMILHDIKMAGCHCASDLSQQLCVLVFASVSLLSIASPKTQIAFARSIFSLLWSFQTQKKSHRILFTSLMFGNDPEHQQRNLLFVKKLWQEHVTSIWNNLNWASQSKRILSFIVNFV